MARVRVAYNAQTYARGHCPDLRVRERYATTRYAWRLASPGEVSRASFRKLSDDPQRQNRLVGFDQDRLDKVKLLVPKQRYIGIDGFDSYSIFTFAYTSKALMECPIVGNAIFVIGSDLAEQWQKMNKQ